MEPVKVLVAAAHWRVVERRFQLVRNIILEPLELALLFGGGNFAVVRVHGARPADRSVTLHNVDLLVTRHYGLDQS